MTKLLLKNIKNLVQVRKNAPAKLSGKEMSELPCIDNAWMVDDDELIVVYGRIDDCHGMSD